MKVAADRRETGPEASENSLGLKRLRAGTTNGAAAAAAAAGGGGGGNVCMFRLNRLPIGEDVICMTGE